RDARLRGARAVVRGQVVGLMSAPEVRYAISADGTEIAYVVLGSGQPIMVLDTLFHGLQSRLSQPRFRPVYEALLLNGSLILMDFRGCGHSGVAHQFGLDDLVADVKAVVAGAGLEEFDLWAYAFSGMVALAYAVEEPKQVSKLVLSVVSPEKRSPLDTLPG